MTEAQREAACGVLGALVLTIISTTQEEAQAYADTAEALIAKSEMPPDVISYVMTIAESVCNGKG
jgi:hypothetical protein